MTIIPRADWLAKPLEPQLLIGPLPKVVIHHSFQPDIPVTAGVEAEKTALRSIDRYHREDRGWMGFGYSFAVFQSGRVYEGRGWLRAGAHTEGQNSKSHGICWIIDGSVRSPSEDSIQAVRALIGIGVGRGAITPGYSVHPHDEFKNKVCPGSRVKAVLPRLVGVGGAAAAPVVIRALLRLGDRGEDVRRLQVALGMTPAFRTGYFGTMTEAAVKRFQASHGLTPDGVVGPATRAALPVL